MLTTMHYILLLFLILFSNKIVCQTDDYSSRKTIVVIDPGHGGRDSGALSRNGIMEKDITLAVAEQIINVGKTMKSEKVKIYLTRYSDTLVSLSDRIKLARKLKADVFISLHCNHSNNPKARGVEVYVSKHKSKTSDKSILLAYLLEKSLSLNIGMKSRGVKFANFQVLRDNNSRVSVLVELGFLSQTDEEVYLSSKAAQLIIAKLLSKSIIKNLGF